MINIFIWNLLYRILNKILDKSEHKIYEDEFIEYDEVFINNDGDTQNHFIMKIIRQKKHMSFL